MSRYSSMIVLLFIPALLALGHDLYLSIYVENFKNGIRYSDYGFILLQYFPKYHQSLLIETPQQYSYYLNFILQQKAFIVFVCYGFIMPILMGLQYGLLSLLFGGKNVFYSQGPSYGANSRVDKILNRNQTSEKFKYKRK